VTNEASGNPVISGGSFDMNTLGAATVTDVTLVGTSDVDFSDGDRWTVSLVSDDGLFNGSEIYWEMVFRPA
jgi:hypothetical protein